MSGLGLIALVWVFVALTPTEVVDGPAGSSFVTTERGVAALASLLERNGTAVTRIGEPLEQAPLEDVGTLVMFEPGVLGSPVDTGLLVEFARDGGVVVVAGNLSDAMVGGLLGEGSALEAGGPSTGLTVQPIHQMTGAMVTEGARHLVRTGEAQVVVAGEGKALVAQRHLGDGRIAVVADIGPFTNRLIDHADNALLALAILESGPVAFYEFPHGYLTPGRNGGWLGSAPPAARATILLLGVAVGIGLITYARRLGPPETETRLLAPERIGFVEAVAGILRRTNRLEEAIEPIRTAVRHRLATRSGSGSSPQHARAAGSAAGLTEEELSAVFDHAHTPEAVLAADRALAKLTKKGY